MPTANLMLAITEPELRAASRVLQALLASDHPMVQRAIEEAMAGAPRSDLTQASRHLHAALRLGKAASDSG